jgi:hypothetical protein
MLDVSALYIFCTAATRLPTHEHILAMLSVSDAKLRCSLLTASAHAKHCSRATCVLLAS